MLCFRAGAPPCFQIQRALQAGRSSPPIPLRPGRFTTFRPLYWPLTTLTHHSPTPYHYYYCTHTQFSPPPATSLPVRMLLPLGKAKPSSHLSLPWHMQSRTTWTPDYRSSHSLPVLETLPLTLHSTAVSHRRELDLLGRGSAGWARLAVVVTTRPSAVTSGAPSTTTLAHHPFICTDRPWASVVITVSSG